MSEVSSDGMSSPRSVVLIVEDVPAYQVLLAGDIGNVAEALSALTIPDAYVHLSSRSDITHVIMDGCVGGDGETLNTLELIRDIRESGFAGPIIAASSNSEFRLRMVEAGCDVNVAKGDLLRDPLPYLAFA